MDSKQREAWYFPEMVSRSAAYRLPVYSEQSMLLGGCLLQDDSGRLAIPSFALVTYPSARQASPRLWPTAAPRPGAAQS